MSNALKKAISEISKGLEEKIKMRVITGNTIMLHFYNEIDATPISQYPFSVPCHFGNWIENTYFPSCISAYVGADAVTSIIASNMLKSDFPSHLIDIGTNGEIVLFDGEELCATSTAAGPALEGASISMGMPAMDGAIKKVLKNGEYEIIGNTQAKGICASGLIDAVCYMLSSGVLLKDGYLKDDFEIGKSGVFLNPEDIRKVQLAKAAIKAGIDTLLSLKGIKANELKKVYIAGTLGNNVNIENCIKIGLIPSFELSEIELLGNAALRGSAMILKDTSLCKEAENIAKVACVYELALTEEFTRRYIESMSF